jgi:hypothetical protein
MSRIKLNDIAIDETATREALERVIGGLIIVVRDPGLNPFDPYCRKAGGTQASFQWGVGNVLNQGDAFGRKAGFVMDQGGPINY